VVLNIRVIRKVPPKTGATGPMFRGIGGETKRQDGTSIEDESRDQIRRQDENNLELLSHSYIFIKLSLYQNKILQIFWN
jgi:hypothetical protein